VVEVEVEVEEKEEEEEGTEASMKKKKKIELNITNNSDSIGLSSTSNTDNNTHGLSNPKNLLLILHNRLLVIVESVAMTMMLRVRIDPEGEVIAEEATMVVMDVGGTEEEAITKTRILDHTIETPKKTES